MTDWREIDAESFFLIHWFGHSHKPKNENVLKLWSKENGCPFFHKIISRQKYSILTMQVQN